MVGPRFYVNILYPEPDKTCQSEYVIEYLQDSVHLIGQDLGDLLLFLSSSRQLISKVVLNLLHLIIVLKRLCPPSDSSGNKEP